MIYAKFPKKKGVVTIFTCEDSNAMSWVLIGIDQQVSHVLHVIDRPSKPVFPLVSVRDSAQKCSFVLPFIGIAISRRELSVHRRSVRAHDRTLIAVS